jgi:hypothetical protein
MFSLTCGIWKRQYMKVKGELFGIWKGKMRKRRGKKGNRGYEKNEEHYMHFGKVTMNSPSLHN